MVESVPLIRQSIEKLGFKFSDTKILLISHAHLDHCAGSAEVKRLTGAKYEVMEADVPTVESGGKEDFQYGATRRLHSRRRRWTGCCMTGIRCGWAARC